MQQFIPQGQANLKCEGLVIPLAIIRNDNVQHSVKCKLDFDKLKSIFRQKLS